MRTIHIERSRFGFPAFQQDTALNFVQRISVSTIRDDLWESIEDEAVSELLFGELTLTASNHVAGIRSYWGKSTVWLRGNQSSYCEVCPTCGQLIYNPMGKRWYLMERDVPDAEVFTTHYGGLVLSERIYSRIADRKWMEIDIHAIPVLATPKDGFPADLTKMTPAMARRPPWKSMRSKP